MSKIIVKDFIEREIPKLEPGFTLLKIAEVFSSCSFLYLPVIDSKDKFYGILPIDNLIKIFVPTYFSLFKRLDLVKDFGALEINFLQLQKNLFVAQDLVDDEIIFLDEHDSLLKATAIMLSEKKEQMPVLSNGIFTGIIRKTAIAKAISHRNR